MFFVVVLSLFSQWFVGYNIFMDTPKKAAKKPAPLDPVAVGLHRQLTEIESAIKVARFKLPQNPDGAAETLIPIVDSVEEILYKLGYELSFDNDDLEPTFERTDDGRLSPFTETSLPEPLDVPAKRAKTDPVGLDPAVRASGLLAMDE
jgi:hypothetical protein